jgi:sec-independent protein translocase protein TatC
MDKIKGFVERFSPHLEDVRKRLYITCIFFVAFFVVGFVSTRSILEVILSVFDIKDVVIATTSPFQFANLSINIGLFLASLVSLPVLAFNIFAFLGPALSKRERGLAFMLMPLSLMLFVLGFAYGFLIMYYALLVLAQINTSVGIQNIWDIGMFLTQIVLTSSLLGVLFQFPILMTWVIRTGLVTVSFLKGKRRVAVFVIFAFSTLLPPTDGLSLLAMALPLILLYEVTIFVNSRSNKRQTVAL